MRILVVNKFWYPRGGLERVMFDEIAWLEADGHETAHFSTLHPDNDPSPWSDYFVPYVELGANGSKSPWENAAAAGRMFWNAEAARQFARLLHDFRPEVVHVHGIHRHISPSILLEAKRAGVPVAQSLHDYHPICAADTLLVGQTRACDPPRCGRFNNLPCVMHKCVQRRRLRSLLAAAELAWRRWAVRYETFVDAFISPSRYLARAVTAGGLQNTPIHVLPNAVPPLQARTSESAGDGFAYTGRLSPEKGLPTLIRAVNIAGVSLTVAGTGPLYDSLVRNNHSRHVRFVGGLRGPEVDSLLAQSRASIVPSEWAENAPMAVLEAMRLGRPVIASRIGGIPEQVRDGVDGILTTPGDWRELAAALRLLADEPSLANQLGRSAHLRAATLFSPQAHVEGLLAIYSRCSASRLRGYEVSSRSADALQECVRLTEPPAPSAP